MIHVAVGAGVYAWTEAEGLNPDAVLAVAPMIGRLAKEFRRWGATVGAYPEDLRQAGFVGALRAARTFDPARGMCFSSWASYRARDAMEALCRGMFCLSLDSPAGDGLDDLGDLLGDPGAPGEDGLAAAMDAELVLGRLDADDRELLARRYGLGGGCETGTGDLAKDAGVTKYAMSERIKQARQRARRGFGRRYKNGEPMYEIRRKGEAEAKGDGKPDRARTRNTGAA